MIIENNYNNFIVADIDNSDNMLNIYKILSTKKVESLTSEQQSALNKLDKTDTNDTSNSFLQKNKLNEIYNSDDFKIFLKNNSLRIILHIIINDINFNHKGGRYSDVFVFIEKLIENKNSLASEVMQANCTTQLCMLIDYYRIAEKNHNYTFIKEMNAKVINWIYKNYIYLVISMIMPKIVEYSPELFFKNILIFNEEKINFGLRTFRQNNAAEYCNIYAKYIQNWQNNDDIIEFNKDVSSLYKNAIDKILKSYPKNIERISTILHVVTSRLITDGHIEQKEVKKID